jgi:hypothetical protein
MSSSYVSAELRRIVVERADSLCEYCLIAEEDTFFGCEIDHIISEKHGGLTVPENLALACVSCNQSKGSDIASIDPSTGELTRFFNPRSDLWSHHFVLAGSVIDPLTSIGRVTVRILGFNDYRRREERRVLKAYGRYPTIAARKLMP